MLRATAIFLSMMLSVAVLEAKEVSPETSRYGGTLVWGVAYKPTIINPILTTQSVSASLQGLIFNELIRLNAKGEIEPDLAESWEISEDGLVYTFHLRKGVKFHDGVECTAEDVKFTFDAVIDPKVNSPFRSFFSLVAEFTAADKYTFQVVLTKPSAPLLYRFIRPIAPKHILGNADPKNSPFNYRPIGTGPFKFREWTKDDQIILEYNPDYYEGRPYLDKIIVKTYANSQQLWAAIMRQEVDLVLFIEREDYDILKNDPLFRNYAYPIDHSFVISYNLKDPILSDLTVRKAIACGINRKEVIEKISFGHGVECNGPFYFGSIGYNPMVKPFGFNPGKAKQLLAEAAWQDLNNDGILEKEGQDLEIRMLVDERNEIYRKMAMLFRQQLQEIGIKLVIFLYNDDMELTKSFLERNKIQAQLNLLPTRVDPDQVFEEWTTQGPEKIYKLWEYDNFEVERYFSLGKATLDKNKKRWIYQEIHKFIYEDQPLYFLYFPFFFHSVSSRIDNTDDFFTLNMPYNSMRKWFIKHQ
ncbi:MAG: ABC transporter substrate-binding protein [Candidatus Omnitrophota bacterium]